MSKLKVDEIRSADRSVSDSANITLADNGNVGVGVAPSDQGTGRSHLHIHSSSTDYSYLSLTNNTSGSDATANGTNILSDGNNFKILNRESGGDITLQTTGAGDVVMPNGNVGIGTTSPSYKLETKDGDISAVTLGSASGGTSVNGIRFRINNSSTPSQFASLGKVSAETESGWGGSLIFSTKPANGSPNESVTERMRIDSSGSITAGSVSTNGVGFQLRNDGILIHSKSGTGVNTHARYANGNGIVGSITTNVNATAYNTSSDYRLKENVTPLIGAIDRLNQLKPSRFNFISDPETIFDGFLAHEVSDYVPEAVTGEKDAVDENGDIDAQGVDQSKLVPLLVASVQELSAKVTALENA